MPGSTPARAITVVDDHTIIRRGLRNLISARIPNVTVKDLVGLDDLMLSLKHPPRPELLILDLQLNDGNAMDRIEELLLRYAPMRVLVYSMNPERIYAQRVIAMGCSGYLSKDASEDEVIKAVQVALDGGTYLSFESEMRQLELGGRPDGGPDRSPFDRLSGREIRVVDEMLTGAGVKEISVRMKIGITTVATYKARLFDKLGIDNAMELQALARAHGYRTP